MNDLKDTKLKHTVHDLGMWQCMSEPVSSSVVLGNQWQLVSNSPFWLLAMIDI